MLFPILPKQCYCLVHNADTFSHISEDDSVSCGYHLSCSEKNPRFLQVQGKRAEKCVDWYLVLLAGMKRHEIM